ncbi:hypothetical protein NVP1101O_167 [Vibrio phage 1.101.O._10N.261.45.C6]|nr:hypothetical protein NVP1101O_167 [Vibrio phage 1.101.O._10N.261.45.C6]
MSEEKQIPTILVDTTNIDNESKVKEYIPTCGRLIGTDLNEIYNISKLCDEWFDDFQKEDSQTKIVGKAKQPWYHKGRW